MRFAVKNKLETVNLYDKINLTISVEKQYKEALEEFASEFEQGVLYNIEVKKAKDKRSNDANAYAWVLIGKLAEAMGITPIEVYRQQVLDMYTYRDGLIREEEFEAEKREWEKNHKGRMLEMIGPCRTQPGWVWARKYRSSSDYDTTEMSKFIDLIVFECKELGIETRTPAELDKLKEDWGNH